MAGSTPREHLPDPARAAHHSAALRLGNRKPLTQREIAVQCGISRSYVSRIEKRALQKLEDALTKET